MLSEAPPPYTGLAAREDGKIWSLETHQWLDPKEDESGYLIVHFKNCYFKAHRIIAATFLPEPDGGWDSWEVDHKDRNRWNNRIENLRPLNHADNMTNRDVNKVVRLVWPDGTKKEFITMAAAAAEIGVNRSTIKRALDNSKALSTGIRVEEINNEG